MAIRAKRLGGAVAEKAPPSQEEEQKSLEEARAERLAEGVSQLAKLRQEHIEITARFARGWLKYQEASWEWPEGFDGYVVAPPSLLRHDLESLDDWNTDPETWPPLVKLAWLYDRLHGLHAQINWLRHFPDRPNWCSDCHEGKRPKGWRATICVDHLPRTGVLTVAKDWGVMG